MSAPTARKPSAWMAFAEPSAWTMFFFGFASGLPFLLVAGTLAYWLREDGLELKDITMIASAGLAYSFKFLWAPLVDRWRLPLFGRLGQRRGWLLLAQLVVMGGLIAMAGVGPGTLPLFIALTVTVALAGATLDIAVDAYRIEIAPPESQGALVATYSLGYRIALIVTGALALVLADHAVWPNVYRAMAAVMLIPIVANLMAREPDVVRVRAQGWAEAMREGVVEPFADFFRRFGGRLGLAVLAFILLFKISDQALVGGIIGPFYLDQGFTKTQIAAVSKVYGIWVGIGGAFVGIRFGSYVVTRRHELPSMGSSCTSSSHMTSLTAKTDTCPPGTLIAAVSVAPSSTGKSGPARITRGQLVTLEPRGMKMPTKPPSASVFAFGSAAMRLASASASSAARRAATTTSSSTSRTSS